MDESMAYKGIGIQKEILWANIFHDTIRGSKWLSKETALSPGRWALGYPGLYLLYRVLDETEPDSILELGLGQSTKLIEEYSKYKRSREGKCEHVIIEDDDNWIDFFCRRYPISEETNLIHARRVEEEYDVDVIGKTSVYMYDNFQSIIGDRQFDLIFIDGPWGSKEYSRLDVATIMPRCLKDQFVIILDDCERTGEQRTFAMMQKILIDNGVTYHRGIYDGEKITGCIVSEHLSFLCSM